MEGSAFASKWGALPSKSDEDARCLALGCKLQMLVSLGVFGMIKSLYLHNHDQDSLSTVHKEIYTDHTEMTLTTQKSPLGVRLSLSHTHMGLPLGV